ncbi:hypothetical protein SPSYN_01580 [Sporotomaculum syntrophicum]|uniref:Uncharacterized protein n=1 Tax=Sporotomaculum syntrophicum TaxID=182264 RepID=A0A9D3AZ26_9FIRM|nr:hypothetical protein SPSYN_01580 [Sporotomaculum syntrophicum]
MMVAACLMDLMILVEVTFFKHNIILLNPRRQNQGVIFILKHRITMFNLKSSS